MNRLTTKEMVREFEEQKDPIQLYKDMDLFINSFTIPIKEFLNEMNNQKPETKERWTIISLLWIKKLATFYENSFYDLRNEESCKVAYQIKNTYTGTFPDKQAYEFENTFVEVMAKNHRTLQQNFSRLVCQWLEIIEQGEEYFKNLKVSYYLPYI